MTSPSAPFTDPPVIAGQGWRRLRILPNPLRMAVSSGVWSAAWYLLSSFAVGVVLVSVVVTLVSVSAALTVVWAGLPMLIGTAFFIRGCVAFERGRARAVVPEGLPALPPVEPSEGFFALLQARWRDRVTLRGLAHFTLLFIPLALLDAVAFFGWLAAVGSITLPVWYRYIPAQDGHTGHGLEWLGFWVGSDGAAIGAAGLAVALFLAWNYLLVGAARLHVTAVRSIIVDRDPLADARRVLAAPGPLSGAAGTPSVSAQ